MATGKDETVRYLDFALLQLGAESYLHGLPTNVPIDLVANRLKYGFNDPTHPFIDPASPTGRARDRGGGEPSGPNTAVLPGYNRMVERQARDLLTRWEIIDHHPNDATGFSATLWKKIGADEYALSFRSTEFRSWDTAGDNQRDQEGANAAGIVANGFAFAQLASMEDYWSHIRAGERWQVDPADATRGRWEPDQAMAAFRSAMEISATLNVTGYSLGGHLAQVFTLLHDEVTRTNVFNSAGHGVLQQGETDRAGIAAMLEVYRRALLEPSSFDVREVFGTAINSAGHLELTALQARASAMADQERGPFDSEGGIAIAAAKRSIYNENDGRNEFAMRVVERLHPTATLLGTDLISLLSIAPAVGADLFANLFGRQDFSAAARAIEAGKGSERRTDGAYSKITSLYGQADTDDYQIVANSQRHGGNEVRVFIEDQPDVYGNGDYLGQRPLQSQIDALALRDNGDFGTTHSLALIVDALSTIKAVQEIDGSLSMEQVAAMLSASSNQRGESNFARLGDATTNPGLAEGDSLESLVNALRKTFYTPADWLAEGVPDSAEIDRVNNGFGNFVDRSAFHDNLADLVSRAGAGVTITGLVVGEPGNIGPALQPLGAPTLIAAASGDDDTGAAYRYALRELNPFVVQKDGLYAERIASGELGLWTGSDGAGQYTDAEIRTRAEVLSRRIVANLGNLVNDITRPITTTIAAAKEVSDPEGLRIEDRNLTQVIIPDRNKIRETQTVPYVLQWEALPRDALKHWIFGTDKTDHLRGGDVASGQRFDDRLFGGGRADLLEGRRGNDYLEGGKGSDVYAYDAVYPGTVLLASSNDGDDTIRDVDGKGVIRSTYTHNVVFGANTTYTNVVAGLFFREPGVEDVWQSIDRHVRLERLAGTTDDGQPSGRHDLKVTFTDRDGNPRPGSITIKDFRDGDLIIRLLDGRPSQPPPFENTILGGDPVEGAAPDQWGNREARPGTLDGEFANTLNGTDRPDRILGGGGRDTLNGYAAAASAGGAAPTGDWLEGGAGRDRITGSDADDLIEGGGNEFSVTDRGGDILEGRAGDDRIFGSERIGLEEAVQRGEDPNVVAIVFAPVDLLSGGAGDDELVGSEGADLLLGGAGRDILIGGVGADTILTDVEMTSASYNWSIARTVSGNEFRVDFDRITGHEPGLGFGQPGDVAYGGRGNDWIFGGNADDVLDGGADDDVLIGGGGADVLVGGTGNDNLSGDSGSDPIALQGDDILDGGDGDDRLVGAGGGDILFGGNGQDHLSGNDGDDILMGEAGDDRLLGDDGDDVLFGGDGDDTLDGYDGDDRLDGGAGRDTLIGGAGRDTLTGGAGADVLQGGAGRDTYIFNRGDGVEVIYDPDDAGSVGAPPNPNNPDKSILVLGDGIRRENVRFGSGSLKIDFGDGDAIHLVLPAGSDDPSAAAMFAHIEFADGSILTWADVLAQGFDLDGTEFIAPVLDAGGQVIDPGQNGDDILVGTDNAATRDRMRGLSGNDLLLGRAGDDLLEGGAGDDTLDGGTGDDTLTGGAGFDLLKGGARNDRYVFAVGDGAEDIIDDSEGLNTLAFGPGIDVLAVDATPLYNPTLGSSPFTLSLIYGVPGFGTARVWLRGALESGNTRVELADGRVLTHAELLARVERSLTVVGDAGPNVIAGGRGGDFLYGQGGDDTIDGLAGNDVISGGAGDDRIDGELGEDRLVGGAGNDLVFGGAGHDQIYGEEGDDLLDGGFGADQLSGGEGNDRLTGGPDNDLLDGGLGDDVFVFVRGDGRDVITDTGGTTTIEFGAGLTRAEARASLVNDSDGTTLLRLDFGGEDTLLVRAGLTRAQDAAPTRFVFADGRVDDVRSLLADALDGSIDYFAGDAAIDLAGGRHRDRIVGSAGDDRIAGNGGDDVLAGLAGADDIDGGAGDDVIDGGAGDDLMAGGAGADAYRLARGMGRDRIVEVTGGVNTLALETGIVIEDLRAARRGDDLVIDLGGSADSVTLADYYAGTGEWRISEAAGRPQGMAEFLRTAVAPPVAASPVEAMAAFEADARAYWAAALLQGGYVADAAGDYLRDATTHYGNTLEFRDIDRVRLAATTVIEAPRDDALLAPAQPALRVTRQESGSTTALREIERPDTRGTMFVSYAQGGNLIAAGRVIQGPIPPADPLPQMPLVRTDGIEIRASSTSRGYGVPVYASAPTMGASGLAAPIVGFNVFPNSAGEGFAPPTLREQLLVTQSRNERDTDLRVVRTTGGAGANRINVEGGMAADGGDGDDIVTAGALPLPLGAAELAGRPGSFLYGAGGDDTLLGATGNDLLADDRGNNFMDGGAGSDRYLIFAGPGVHTIWDRGGWSHPGAMVMQDDLDFWLAGNRDKDTVELPDGVARGDLVFGWSVENLPVSRAANRRHGILYMNDLPLAVPTGVLSVSWGTLAGGGSVRVVMPHSDDPVGAGIEALRLADGTILTRADLLTISPFDQDPNRRANVLAGDNLDGESGDDRISGNGVLRGGEGNDTIIGGGGRDAITGDEGADSLEGGAGDDLLGFGIREYMGAGNFYRGGTGNDIVLGSHTADVFAFERGDGADLIGDYGHDPGNSPVTQRFLPRVARQFGDLEWFGNYTDATFRDTALHPGIPEAHIGIDTLRLGAGIDPAAVGFVRTNALDYSPYSGPPNPADAPQADPAGTDLVLDLGAGDSVRLVGFFPRQLAWWEYEEGGAPPPAVPHPLGRIEFADGTVWDRAILDHRAAGGAHVPVNRAPRAVGTIADQGVVSGASFDLRLADDLIADPDGDTLTWSAQRLGAQGQAASLPAWLGFDAHTRRFTGVPANADAGNLRLVVSATDPAGLVATREFNLAVTAAPHIGGSAGDGASGGGSNTGGSSGGASSESSGGTSGGASGGATAGDGSSGGTSSGNGPGSASGGGTGDGATGSSANETLALGASRPSAAGDAMAAPENQPLFAGEMRREAAIPPVPSSSHTLDAVDRLLVVLGYLNPDGSPGPDRYALPPSEGPEFDVRRFLRAPRDATTYGDGTRGADADAGDAGEPSVTWQGLSGIALTQALLEIHLANSDGAALGGMPAETHAMRGFAGLGVPGLEAGAGGPLAGVDAVGMRGFGGLTEGFARLGA